MVHFGVNDWVAQIGENTECLEISEIEAENKEGVRAPREAANKEETALECVLGLIPLLLSGA